MYYYFKKGKKATDQMCQKWFVKLHAGDFQLDGAPHLGRPVEVDSDQIDTLIENNQHYAMQVSQNIQSNKVIGENEKCVLFYGKNYMNFLANLIHQGITGKERHIYYNLRDNLRVEALIL